MLVSWARRAGTRDFLPCLSFSGQLSTNYFFPHRTLFKFMCPPHRLAIWAGSRAGHPVSEYVSEVSPMAPIP
jgi:hypothetical protein